MLSKHLNTKTDRAYERCIKLASSHYENFPVASMFLPAHLRRAIAAIYAFARTGDDIADEGNISSDQRLELMTRFESKLYDIQYGKPPSDDIFIALKHSMDCFNLPIQLFYDLLTAFRQDILKNRYSNFQELKDYCHYSANPIGRLLLYLTNQASRKNLHYSDSICTGLQLLNFIQDIEIDMLGKDRCYIPIDDLKSLNLCVADLKHPNYNSVYSKLINQQVERAAAVFCQGIELGNRLPGFFGIEIRFIINCGLELITKLKTRSSLQVRPTLSKSKKLMLLIKSLAKTTRIRTNHEEPMAIV